MVYSIRLKINLMALGEEEDIVKASLSFPSQYASHLSFGFFFNIAIVYCIPQLRKVRYSISIKNYYF